MLHIVLPRALDVVRAEAAAADRTAPRHGMAVLARRLGGRVHGPTAEDMASRTLGHSLRSHLAGPPGLWALARRVLSEAASDDVVFCPSEAGGLQVAALAASMPRRPRVVMFFHNLDRPRARLALRLWPIARGVDLFLAVSQLQVDFLRTYLGLGGDRVAFMWDHTDTKFFVPGPGTPSARPAVVSVGLEQRDYHSLATATEGLGVDVRISGFSKDAAVLARSIPSPLPAHMTMRFYEWPELAQLYRDADVAVVTCRENGYAAGVQGLMEAMASGRPIVVTRTTGLARYVDPAAMLAVVPGDPAAMRRSIESLLRDREMASALARQARILAEKRHDMDVYVAELAHALR